MRPPHRRLRHIVMGSRSLRADISSRRKSLLRLWNVGGSLSVKEEVKPVSITQKRSSVVLYSVVQNVSFL